eukprot:CAMPEP_0197030876 /NCGR_PEP_ID=MMETSP1384-20130603/10011_1 /TAXON_ID=29189 /ORGANISM="Ammonia sp." /LENGTH=595 /DNA_ID=CAMNT_0042460305 /DNA_START=18 /DNA_END=1805 /DNA_ORIENTATION=-
MANKSCAVLNASLFKPAKIESFKKDFNKASPFPYIRIPSFLRSDFITKLEQSLDENITFAETDNDLYHFFQSYGLEESPQKSAIQDLIHTLYSASFRDFLFQITGKKVSAKPDLFASCYTDTSYLLCHDDQVEDRCIAFILYLVPSDWNKTDGGALNIYDSYTVDANPANTEISNSSKPSTKGTENSDQISVNVFPKHEPFKQLIPERNSVVLFQVSDTSFHAVDEVLTAEKNRIAIGGWWHYEDASVHELNLKKVAVADPPIVWQPCVPLKSNGVALLAKWINPTYLKGQCMQQMQEKFVEDSHVTLMNFINDELYYKLLQQLFAVKLASEIHGDKAGKRKQQKEKAFSWKLKGPIHRRLYYGLEGGKGNESEYALVAEFQQMIRSPEWRQFMEKITSLKLQRYSLETRKFERRHYTIAHDLDRFKETAGLDVNLQFIEDEEHGWQPECGGSIHYTMGKQTDEEEQEDEEDVDIQQKIASFTEDSDEDEEGAEHDGDGEGYEVEESGEDNDGILMSVHTFPNTLSITYRSQVGVMSFVKYLNHNAPCSKIDVNQVWTVEDVESEQEENGGDGKKRKVMDGDDEERAPPKKKQKV